MFTPPSSKLESWHQVGLIFRSDNLNLEIFWFRFPRAFFRKNSEHQKTGSSLTSRWGRLGRDRALVKYGSDVTPRGRETVGNPQVVQGSTDFFATKTLVVLEEIHLPRNAAFFLWSETISRKCVANLWMNPVPSSDPHFLRPPSPFDTYPLGKTIDSGNGFSIAMDQLWVFINQTRDVRRELDRNG